MVYFFNENSRQSQKLLKRWILILAKIMIWKNNSGEISYLYDYIMTIYFVYIKNHNVPEHSYL